MTFDLDNALDDFTLTKERTGTQLGSISRLGVASGQAQQVSGRGFAALSKLHILYIPTDSDGCAFAPKKFRKLPKNTISRHYEITNKRLLSCTKELVHNV